MNYLIDSTVEEQTSIRERRDDIFASGGVAFYDSLTPANREYRHLGVIWFDEKTDVFYMYADRERIEIPFAMMKDGVKLAAIRRADHSKKEELT